MFSTRSAKPNPTRTNALHVYSILDQVSLRQVRSTYGCAIIDYVDLMVKRERTPYHGPKNDKNSGNYEESRLIMILPGQPAQWIRLLPMNTFYPPSPSQTTIPAWSAKSAPTRIPSASLL